MSADPNTPGDEESGSGWFPMILAIVISVIALLLVVPNTRRHASSMDEPKSSAATETRGSAGHHSNTIDDSPIGSRKVKYPDATSL